MPAFEELKQWELSVSQPDPVVFELNRLQNLLKEKDKELGVAQGEIKALRAAEALRTKAVEELENEISKLDGKLRASEIRLQQKNLEIKRLNDEKKDALAAQYAAEVTLRRVHANQKDDVAVPLESIVAPLEANIKIYKNKIALLMEDKKALERLTKSKEAALLETERILRSALERALIVEEIQNQNFELKRQIEIFQEENRILEKTNRQKVLEVEKLSETIQELEEAILAGGAAANVIRDYRRQISELNEEKRILERELARARISANRVATVVANEWKDERNRVMPVKQWLEERQLLQAEMQRLRDKLAITERTARAEAQLKDKLKLRLKTLEEGLKHASGFSANLNAIHCSPKTPKSKHILGFLSNNSGLRKKSTPQPSLKKVIIEGAGNVAEQVKRGGDTQQKYVLGGKMLRRSLQVSKSKVVDSSEAENAETIANEETNANFEKRCDDVVGGENKVKHEGKDESQRKKTADCDGEDVVSGFLYDRLQKEVIGLRKSCEDKDTNLNNKNEEIKMLMKKIDTLTKAIEVESRKVKTSTREKVMILAKIDDNKRIRNKIFTEK